MQLTPAQQTGKQNVLNRFKIPINSSSLAGQNNQTKQHETESIRDRVAAGTTGSRGSE